MTRGPPVPFRELGGARGEGAVSSLRAGPLAAERRARVERWPVVPAVTGRDGQTGEREPSDRVPALTFRGAPGGPRPALPSRPRARARPSSGAGRRRRPWFGWEPGAGSRLLH